MISPEALEQERVIQWAKWMSNRVPCLDLLIHIPNGGKRDAREAAHLKRLGVRAGVSDLFLPVARNGFHGLWIEMKAGKGKPTEAQLEWLDLVRQQGYRGHVCTGADAAIAVLEDYLGMEVL